MPGLVAGTLESAAFEPERFDGLVIWDVLEHLYNLVEVMEHCVAVLRPGGYLFATIHRAENREPAALRAERALYRARP